MSKGRDVPKRIQKQLFQEANSRCFICGVDDVSTLVVHHIVPFADNSDHNPAHMIVLCSNCHAKADRGEITRETLYSAKKDGRKIIPFPQKKKGKDHVMVTGDGNVTAGGDIHIGGDVNIKFPKKGKSSGPVVIPGTVGADPRKRGYLKHLIDRYNEFKKWECEKKGSPFKYQLIYVSYKRKIKYNWSHTPLVHFDAGVGYLQKRIENTMLGRIRKKEGEKLYSSFETFDQKEG